MIARKKRISYDFFLDFLQENSCERQFKTAFECQNANLVMDNRLWEMLSPDEALFGFIFNWADTAEGRDYWKEIDEKWYQTVKNL